MDPPICFRWCRPRRRSSALFPYTTLFRSLTFVTGGGYTASDVVPGHWALAQKSVFIGHTQEGRSEEHTSELQPHSELVCRLLLGKKKPAGARREQRAGLDTRRHERRMAV